MERQQRLEYRKRRVEAEILYRELIESNYRIVINDEEVEFLIILIHKEVMEECIKYFNKATT